MRYKRKLNKKLNQMISASSYSETPLKEILKLYNSVSIRGFESEAIKKTL